MEYHRIRLSLPLQCVVDSSWNVMAHGDARQKWRGNWRMQCATSTLHTTSEHGVSSITTAEAHTSAASSRLNWRPPADLNGLARFAERRNLVSARVITFQLASTLPSESAATEIKTWDFPSIVSIYHAPCKRLVVNRWSSHYNRPRRPKGRVEV